MHTFVEMITSTLKMRFRSNLAVSQSAAAKGNEEPSDLVENLCVRPALTRFCGLLAGVLLFYVTSGPAQQTITSPALQLTAPSDTIASPVPGVGHDYIKMLAETVNPENGAVNLNISIPTPPGRGLNFPFSIQYNSNQALFLTPSFQNLNFGLQWFNGIGEFNQGAWSYGVPLLSRKPYVFNVTWNASNISGYDGSTKCGVLDSYMFTALDGSQYPLNLAHIYDNIDTGYNNSGGDYACAQVPWHESDQDVGGKYSAVLINPGPAPNGSNANGLPPQDSGTTVTGADGTTYRWQGLDPSCSETSLYCFGNPPSSIEDSNGNKINLQVTTASAPSSPGYYLYTYALDVTDTVGRHVVSTQPFGQNGTITVAGDPASYTVTWQNFTYSGYSLNVQNESVLPVNCPTASPQQTGTQAENVISSIKLPNGQSYSFSYDPVYGMISKITYPSGAYVRYVYGKNPLSQNINFNGVTNDTHGSWPLNGVCDFQTDTVAVTDRYVSFNGTTEVQHQHFDYGQTGWQNDATNPIWLTKSTNVTTTDLVTGSSYTTAYNYVGQSGGSGVNFPNTFGEGVEQTTTTTQGIATLRTTNKGWYGPGELACEVDTAAGYSSAKYYQYSAGVQISDIQEFDFPKGNPNNCQSALYAPQAHLTPPSGITPDRETKVKYQAFQTALYLYDKPCWIKKQDGSGNVLAETDYFYDGSVSTGCPTIGSPAATTSSVSNLPPNTHDESGYGPNSGNSRGNVTMVTEKCLSGGCTADLSTALTYDETGQITNITDPCGYPGANCTDVAGSIHTTSYSYQDSPSGGNLYGNSNAFLTKITYPTTPGNVTLQKSFSYNYPTGELASAIDENGQPTNYTYNDPLLRLTEIQGPPDPNNGNQRPTTTYSYNDSAPSPTVTTSELINNSGTWKTSVTVMDGMRHAIQTQLTSDPDGTDFVDTTYNGMGLVYSQSNPHRSSPAPTDGISYTYYDALGRAVAEVHPDGTALTSCYNGTLASIPLPAGVAQICNPHNPNNAGSVAIGTWVDSADELTNDWQRTSDSFGNLIGVLEPNGVSHAPSMETDYAYDALNNLTSVHQWGGGQGSSNSRTRSFIYNSFSQLTSSTNPETGTISYVYDLNGNVSTKTDARGISINYSYDNLNRPYQKTYKVGSASTSDPIACTQYDSGVTGTTYPLGRLTMDWTQPAGTSCAGPGSPQQKPPSNSISSRIISGYDVMGRLNGDQQCPLGSCTATYPFNYYYDLAGDAIQSALPITSGSSLTLASTWDSAQRLSTINVTGQPAGWNTSTYLSKPTLLQVATGTGYDPLGNLVKANLGVTPSGPNGVANIARAFDNRARITSETDGGNTVNTPASQSTGSIILSGSEASGTTQGTSGSGMLSVTGADGQQYECTTTYEWIDAGDSGWVYEPVTTCDYVPDTGTLAVTIGGFTSTANYSSSSTDAALASVLATGFNLNGSPVRAVASGNSFTVTAVATGTSSNYPITISNGDFTVSDPYNTLTGGTNGSTVYDAGTITATITNNSVSPAASYTTSAVTWGQGSTTNTVATSLASAINSAAGTIVTATANGGSVQLTSKTTGSATNYTVSVSVNDTQTASYPSLFPSASFHASPNSMTGGNDITSSYGTVYSYVVPTGGYAANGNLLTYTDSKVMGSWNFQYDTLGRLASASSSPASGQPSNPYPDYCWSYDAFGNRTTQMTASVAFASTQGGAGGCSTTGSLGQNVWAQYNGTVNGTNNNQLSATSLNPNQGQSSGYDLAGNILYDGTNKYLYDGEGRQCAVQTGGTGGPVTGYLYNAEGLRVIKGSMNNFTACPNSAASFTAINQQFLLDSAGNQVTELNGSGGWNHTNLWDGTALDGTYDNKGLHFHLKDPLGTRRVQLAAGSNLVNNVSTAGMVEEYCLSEPFGDALNCYNPPGAPATADDATEHHFTSKERDTESGNDYFKARYFASTMGRFMSPDWSANVEPVPYSKLGDPQTLNLYAYVRNNPMSLADADGHEFPSSLFQVGQSDIAECAAAVIGRCDPLPAQQAQEKARQHKQKHHKHTKPKSPYQASNKAANVIYHETSSLRPQPGKTDAGDLHDMRVDAAHVYKNVHRKSAFQDASTLNDSAQAALRHQVPDALAAYNDSLDAVSEAAGDQSDPTGGANHFFIRDTTLGDQQSIPSWTNGNEISFGPFTTSSSGDGGIKAGDTVYVWITKE